jgi:ParB-like chromosome segregation protein Spo0J
MKEQRIEVMPVDRIKRHAFLMMRVELSQPTITTYAAALESGAEFPPIECTEVDGELLLTNGFHRLAGHQNAGRTEIQAIVTERDMDDALLAAARSDNYNGLKRTNADKRKAILALLENKQWSEMSKVRLRERQTSIRTQ